MFTVKLLAVKLFRVKLASAMAGNIYPLPPYMNFLYNSRTSCAIKMKPYFGASVFLRNGLKMQ